MITKRCPRCSAVVYRLLVDEYDDIKAIECIVCYERWYVEVRNVPAPKNRYVFVPTEANESKSKQNKERKICVLCGKEFLPRSSTQKRCSLYCKAPDNDAKQKQVEKIKMGNIYGSLKTPCRECGCPPLEFRGDCPACQKRKQNPYIKDYL